MAIDDLTAPDQEGTARLRPRARIMRTLGDELISSEMVAVIELVKNAYDADATRVLVRFSEPLEVGEGAIDVIDDGHGMALETVLGAFLEPATSFRREHARSERFGRRVTGEKGIGRFAVSRLADELELVSRRPGDDLETRMLFDWRLFDDPSAYLDQLDVAWERAPAQDIAPGGLVELWPSTELDPASSSVHGTVLRMRRLRTRWTRENLAEVRTGLARLVSPFLFEEQRKRADAFAIIFEAPPAFADLSGLVEPPEALRNPRYTLRGRVEADGHFQLTMTLFGESKPIARRAKIPYGERAPTCGPFEIELRVWDRDREAMAELADRHGMAAAQVRDDLDRAAGVNVYRDGFRVLPYGEPGDDWLGLDARRVNNPTLRLSNNQVVGYVLVSSDTNPELRDQTNREGLLHNQAFDDLRTAVKELISELETARYERRPRRPQSPQERQGGLFSGFDLAPVSEYAAARYPQDARLAELVGRAQQAIEIDVERAQEVVARYRRLATLGELIDKVLHDGRAPLAKIGDEAVIGLRDLDRAEDSSSKLLTRVRERLQTVQRQHDVLATVFRRIEPFGGRRRGRPAELRLEEIIGHAFAVLESDLERLGVAVSLPSSRTIVTVDQAELQEVVVNLLDNSLHWLAQVPRGQRKIEVQVQRRPDEVEILFSDSGPGVREDAREHIFNPYYSTKPDGVGLGLNIAGEIVDEYYGGKLRLMSHGPLEGATFSIMLRRRV